MKTLFAAIFVFIAFSVASFATDAAQVDLTATVNHEVITCSISGTTTFGPAVYGDGLTYMNTYTAIYSTGTDATPVTFLWTLGGNPLFTGGTNGLVTFDVTFTTPAARVTGEDLTETLDLTVDYEL